MLKPLFIKTKDKEKSNKGVPLVTTYHPQLPKLGSIVNKHLLTLHLSPKLRDGISEPPAIAYRRPKNLRDLPVSARLEPAATDTHHTVCTPSNKPCKAYSFQSMITQHTFKILQYMFILACFTLQCFPIIMHMIVSFIFSLRGGRGGSCWLLVETFDNI